MDKIKNPKQVIDRRALVIALEKAVATVPRDQWRGVLLQALKGAYRHGFDEVKARCGKSGSTRALTGREIVQAQCYLVDQIIRVLYDFIIVHVYPQTNPTESERMSVVAVGGYGRGELAPFSDIDLLFLLPYKQTPWGEQVVEYMLYMLWDIGLKVGHATRSVDESIRLSKQDLTIRTAILEARYLWGDRALYDDLKRRFEREVIADSGPEFVERKLQERDERHKKLGDSRYVVEPNLKEGKGGLRDLHTLFWIAKYLYRVASDWDLVKEGVFSEDELREFLKAEDFLWTVRCHLHYIAGRPEERVTFDMQRELAQRLGYADRKNSLGVERFMKHYFLIAKNVGDLTRIFCAHLEEQHKRKPRFRLPRFGLRSRQIAGFAVDGERITFSPKQDLHKDPALMLRLFRVAQKNTLDIHPKAMRIIRQNLALIDRAVQNDPAANAVFLEILTAGKDTENTLRLMSEAGVFGKFIPDFGRVVAQMQHDMYHVYTVDEHTIRAIGILARIETGELEKDHPVSHEVIHKVVARRALYVAVMLHDIAKGRGGDHSLLGAEVAQKLCPRLGLTPAETDLVAWLVQYHLLMSNFAFKRDVADPKTVQDFVQLVKSPERLRLLLVLTVADIRAVGPGIWNGWKGQLLRELYYRAEDVLMGGHVEDGNEKRVSATKADLAARLKGWSEADISRHLDRLYDSYWLSMSADQLLAHARLVHDADRDKQSLALDFRVDDFRAATVVTVYVQDHAGLFARLSGAIAICGASIVDAKIFTTKDGMALDAFWIQDANGAAVNEAEKLDRIRTVIEDTLKGDVLPAEVLSAKPAYKKRTDLFTVEPVVFIDNKASNTYTVIEVNGRDRPGLLFDLARAFFDLNLSISSAHVATYGERAVDVFYVRDLFGHKVTHQNRLQATDARLMEALVGGVKPRRKRTAESEAVVPAS
ncbi:[protein-PII] uridylyltransferase [Govanella unica]|uniref:Bifunctional uridylyltransferase/uridylyl-removing enzyme n=1 Tax=Govanella unica TaxID=2975056 RepID=A0A9X3Z850_9PROT|nr:[protein-PII] uridylyltransferase [Govania unica]MDA5194674.1 [protein-PII] uridylyltransferase [Govania unica]